LQTTTNYGLKKPDGTDNFDIGNENYNMDAIDALIKSNADAAAAAQSTANVAIPATQKGAASGVAPLDASSKVPAANLPIIPVANGGTGSATQNFVDLTTAQTIGGAKHFVNTMQVDGPQIGTSVGDLSEIFKTLANASGSNGMYFIQRLYRDVAGSDWTGVSFEILGRVDVTDKQKIRFEPDGSIRLVPAGSAAVRAGIVELDAQAYFRLEAPSGAHPLKYLRSDSDSFQVLNNAFTTVLISIHDDGTTSFTDKIEILPDGAGIDAALHIKGASSLGRLTQMSPKGASLWAVNLIASTDASSTPAWWSWGVADGVYKITTGTGLSGNGLSIDTAGSLNATGGATFGHTVTQSSTSAEAKFFGRQNGASYYDNNAARAVFTAVTDNPNAPGSNYLFVGFKDYATSPKTVFTVDGIGGTTLWSTQSGGASNSPPFSLIGWNGTIAQGAQFVGWDVGGFYVSNFQDGSLLFQIDGTGAATFNKGPLTVAGSLTVNGSGGSFANSLAGSGYQKLPGGLIMQWGFANVATGSTITYPIGFPTNVFVTHVTPNVFSGTASVSVQSQSTSSFVINHNYGGFAQLFYIAIGH
jgi:hypothetical protein